MRRGLLWLVLAGCGRMGFEPLTIGSTTGDASLDSAPMIARVQAMNPTFVSGPAITSTMNVSTDSVVIAIAYWNRGAATVSVADSSGHTWTALPQHAITTGCHNNIGTSTQMFYAPIVTSGPTNITATQSTGSDPLGLFTVEYSGLSTLDSATGMTAPAASNLATAGALTTSGYDVIVAGFHDSVGGGTMQPGAGMTSVAVDSVSYSLLAEAIGPASTYNINATLPGGASDACWVATAAAFHAR